MKTFIQHLHELKWTGSSMPVTDQRDLDNLLQTIPSYDEKPKKPLSSDEIMGHVHGAVDSHEQAPLLSKEQLFKIKNNLHSEITTGLEAGYFENPENLIRYIGKRAHAAITRAVPR
jgi:hypothetical protein